MNLTPTTVRTLFCSACLLLLTPHAQAWRLLGFGTPSASQRHHFAHRYDGQGTIKWIRLPHRRSSAFYR